MNKKLSIIPFFSLFLLTKPLLSLEWVAAEDRPILAEILAKEQPMLIPKDPEEEAIFGPNHYLKESFAGLNPLQLQCLKDVQKTYQAANQQRVDTLDMDAGPKAMSWKMIAAGAQVLSLAKNRAMKEQVQDLVKAHAATFIKPGENPLEAIALDLPMISWSLKNKFDIAWSAELHHFFPSRVEEYLKKLFMILRPGGRAYVTTLTPSFYPTEVDAYKRALARLEPYPGYMVANLITFTKKIQQPNQPIFEQVLVKVRGLHPEDILLPGVRFLGFSEPINLPLGLHVRTLPRNIDDNFIKFYMAMHKFDAQTLNRIFKEAGFLVDEIFYFDLKDSKIVPAHQFNDDMRLRSRWGIAIKATKPLGTEHKTSQD